MSVRNVETVRSAHQAFNTRDFDRAQILVAPATNVVDHGRGQTAKSRQEFRQWMESFLAMSSDIQLVDARYIDGGEWVTAQFRAVGTQDGPLLSFPASNKRFSLDICEVWHLNAAGEADEGHNYSDGMGLLAQLGHLGAG